MCVCVCVCVYVCVRVRVRARAYYVHVTIVFCVVLWATNSLSAHNKVTTETHKLGNQLPEGTVEANVWLECL